MKNALKLVSSAILGKDYKVVVVGGKTYMLKTPTIHQIVGMAYHLSDVKEGETLKDILSTINNAESYCKALSYLIKGDESITKDLMKGTMDEVVNALVEGYNLISLENFIKLSTLRRSVAKMIAKQRS